MADEEIVAPAEQVPAQPEPRTTASTEPEVVATSVAPAAPEVTLPPPTPEPPPKPKIDYAAQRKQERIDKLTAQLAEANRQLEVAKAGLTTDEKRIQEEIATKAAALAKEQAAQQVAWGKFTDSLNTAIAEGQKTYGTEKFDTKVQALRGLYDPADAEVHGKYINMLQAVLDTGAPAKVLDLLGEDVSEAARIMDLSPTKMGVELGKLALREVEEVSKTPKPITPISGVGRTHVAIAAEDTERADGLDMRVWMERRAAHVQEVNKRAGRRVIP